MIGEVRWRVNASIYTIKVNGFSFNSEPHKLEKVNGLEYATIGILLDGHGVLGDFL